MSLPLHAAFSNALAAANAGRDDRPFFDFSHYDREAAVWPTEFFWAGDDRKMSDAAARCLCYMISIQFAGLGYHTGIASWSAVITYASQGGRLWK